MLDTAGMKKQAKQYIDELGISTLQNISQAVETLSGGQRQAVAVARAAAFGGKVVILDEPTAALGVRETGQVLGLIRDLRERGLAIILISHNMPNVFEVADRILIQRLGRVAGVITPRVAHAGRGGGRDDRRGDARAVRGSQGLGCGRARLRAARATLSADRRGRCRVRSRLG